MRWGHGSVQWEWCECSKIGIQCLESGCIGAGCRMVVAGVGVAEGLGVRTGERVVGWKVKGMMGMVSQGLGCSAGKVGHRWGAENGQFGYAIQRGDTGG